MYYLQRTDGKVYYGSGIWTSDKSRSAFFEQKEDAQKLISAREWNNITILFNPIPPAKKCIIEVTSY